MTVRVRYLEVDGGSRVLAIIGCGIVAVA